MYDPDYRSVPLRRVLPLPGAPTDPQEREVVRRLLHRFRIQLPIMPNEFAGWLPRGLAMTDEMLQLFNRLAAEVRVGEMGGSEKLWLMDYTEVPPSMEQFVSEDYYLGASLGANGLWPAWQEFLTEKVCLDSFLHNLVLTGAIGTGKTLLAAIIILHRICVCAHLVNPFEFYGLARGSSLVFLIMSVSRDTLSATAWQTLLRLMGGCPFFREVCGFEPARHYPSLVVPLKFMAAELAGNTITLTGGSQTQHLIGRNVLAVAMDEANARLDANPQNAAYELFSDARARMASRYQRLKGFMPGISIVASSAQDESTFTERLRQEIDIVGDPPTQLVVRRALYRVKSGLKLKPWWFKVAHGLPGAEPIILQGAYSAAGDPLEAPKDCPFSPSSPHERPPEGTATELVPGDYYEEFARHPRRALQQLSGISLGGTGQLFPSMIDIERCLKMSASAGIENPSPCALLAVSDEDGRHLWEDLTHRVFVTKGRSGYQPKRHPERLRYAHLDLATTGRAGLAICHLVPHTAEEAGRPQVSDRLEMSLTVEFDFILTIVGGRSRPISFDKIKQFLVWLRDMCGFRFGKVTADSYQSVYLLQTLTALGFATDTLSVDRDKGPYLALRAGFEAGRIRLYRHTEFMREIGQLLELERKIDHVSGGSKDATDAVAGAYANAIASDETRLLSSIDCVPVVEGIRTVAGNASLSDPFGFLNGIPPRPPRTFQA